MADGLSSTGRDQVLMTPYQVAQYLQLNKLTVYKYIREGQLPAVKLGRQFRIHKADVDRLLEQHKLPVAPIVARSHRTQANLVIHVDPKYGDDSSVKDAWIRARMEEIQGFPRHDRSRRGEEILTSGSLDLMAPGWH